MKTQLKDKKLLKQVGRKLQQLRKTGGLKQEHVASDLGIKQETLSKYENGRTDITICILMAFARYFNVGYNSLINDGSNLVNASSVSNADEVLINQTSHPDKGYQLHVAQLKSQATHSMNYLKVSNEGNDMLKTTLMFVSLACG